MKLLKSEVNNIWIKFFYVLVLIILLFPYYRIYEQPESGLDNSWKIALELIKAKGLVYGQDVIYTYGPLGALTHRLPITSTPMEFFLSDVFFFINMGILLFLFLPKPLKIYQLLIHFIVFYLTSSLYGEWVHFLLFYCAFFFGVRFFKAKNHWLLAYSIFLSVLIFFVKANYGMISLGLSAMIIAYSFFTRRLNLKELALYAVGGSLLLWLTSVILKTDLPAYFYSSLKVISGYNEAQSVFPNGHFKLFLIAFLIWTTLIVFGVIYSVKHFRQKKGLNISFTDNIFLWGCCVAISFVLMKYAFVRADEGHISAFVKLVNLPLIALPALSTSTLLKKGAWYLFAVNICTYLIFYYSMFEEYQDNSFSIFDNLRTKRYIFPQYFKDIAGKPEYDHKHTYPAEVIHHISDKSVDVVPNEISEIYFNKLNYNPRPTLQSYQAYNEYLDNKNREKYLSDSAPDFVVYGVESIDDKYAWGDETQTLLALLQRYKPTKSWENRLLLEKQPVTKSLKVIKRHTQTVRMGENYNVLPSLGPNTIAVIKIKTAYSLVGGFQKFFFQPSHFSLVLTTEDGKSTSYNSVPVLLDKGIIINSRVDNVHDVKQFFEHYSIPGKTIKTVNLTENIIVLPGYSKEFELEQVFYEIR